MPSQGLSPGTVPFWKEVTAQRTWRFAYMGTHQRSGNLGLLDRSERHGIRRTDLVREHNQILHLGLDARIRKTRLEEDPHQPVEGKNP